MQNEEIVPRAERTQAAIVDAAHQLFLDKGFHGTSMREIAQGAGLAVGGIYNHFASKEEIFVAVLDRYHPYQEILPALESAQGGTVAEFVRDAAQRMVTTFNNRADFLNLMFIELVEFRGEHLPQLFERVFPRVMAFTQRFLNGRAELRPIPTPVLVRVFIGVFFSYVITEQMVGRQMLPPLQDSSLDDFVDIYLNGILKNPDS